MEMQFSNVSLRVFFTVHHCALQRGEMVATRIIESWNHRITGWKRTSKIIKSNHPPNNTMPTKPYPEVPYLHVF